ncbi:acyltransferase [Methylobacterium sp. J-001]|uniref:acyltransferase n=1 Tax=Methylobacterium sp. J-001 TaxID=2836609 RepID=UPI00391B4C41
MSIQRAEFLADARVKILRRTGIKIGVNSSFGSGVHISTGLLTVGDNVRIGAGSRIDNEAQVTIHEWVRMGPEVLLETATHKLLPNGPYRRTSGDEVYKPITIERGCMIYARAIILPGVVIREGCVIGGGAVIDKSTQPNGLYVGNRPRSPTLVFPDN